MEPSKVGNLYDPVACVDGKSVGDLHGTVLAALQELIHILESSKDKKALIDEVAKFCKIQEVTKPLLLDDKLIMVELPMTTVRVPGYVPKIAPGRSVAIEEDYFKWSFVNPHEIRFISFSWRGDVSEDVLIMELGELLNFLKFIAHKFSTDLLAQS